MPELPMLAPASGPRIPTLEKPPEPTAGAKIAEAGQRGIGSADQMFWMERQARRDEEASIMTGKLADYALGEAQIKQHLAGVTDPNEYLQIHQTESNALQQSLMADVPAGPMRDHLASNLKFAYARSMGEATNQSLSLQVQAAQDATKLSLQKWTQVAATTDDPTTEADAKVNIAKAINGNGFWREGEKQELLTKTFGQVDLMRLQHRIDSNDPHVLMELHDPKFQESHPLITPAERETLLNHGVAKMTEGYRMVEDQLKAQIGANETRLDAMAAAGQNIGPEIERLAPFGGVSPDYYKAHMGHPFTQSMPGVAQAFVADVNAAKTQEDLDSVSQRARVAVEMGQLGQKDLSVVENANRIARTHINDAAKQDKDRGEVEINDKLFPAVPSYERQFMAEPKREAVMKYYEMRIRDNKGNVDQAVKDTLDKYKDHMKDGSSGAAIGRLLNAGPKP